MVQNNFPFPCVASLLPVHRAQSLGLMTWADRQSLERQPELGQEWLADKSVTPLD